MKNRAFTLIELLVVVLIVGILAAIAVPQYRLAVGKSRAIEGIIGARSLYESVKLYYLEHGDYPQTKEEAFMGLGISSANKSNYVYYRGPGTIYVAYKNSDIMISRSFQGMGADKKGLVCTSRGVNETDDVGAKICKTLCNSNILTKIFSTYYGCLIP